jgi:hypothetical protein
MTVQSVSTNRDLIVSSIRRAAESHRVDFDYLLTQAKVESGLNPAAKASTSSATGLYQFTAGTWLNVVKRHGDKIGLAEDAAALRSADTDPSRREKILALRKEPEISAQLAARFALDNAQALNAAGHTSVGATELYLAHFLGAGGASSFLDGMRTNPNGSAAAVLPAAAASNTRIFYDGKSPRSFQQIYDRFAGKFGNPSAVALTNPPISNAQDKLAQTAKPTEQTIRKIVAKALANQEMQGPAPTFNGVAAPSTSPVSFDALEKYLKGFALIDHDRGFTPSDTRPSRDTTRGASLHGAEISSKTGDFGQLGTATRLILEAAEPRTKNQD